ncbi:AAA family ATPase [Dehalogenimonas etheniformans]|uniref:Nuclease SbcCD subunit C n=1 Tax=Dehalogenimonas etheniformans TaxID=1536648 RepID=A0A2P5P9K4_9CHLR|nr:SMC family ATPase [Dehalogenimonas etheniformans]PPD58986.1 SMC family ATPase [Dehalogenimonas etheniformans]QNT76247.1 SMC family ATPase [Dehalogenimonas etheniformans]
MKNFLPYRGEITPLSFDGIHLACITGDNGSGKSSIIDAITWALWGKSRLRSKTTSDDDLITQGETETEISFDFRTGDNQIYRVVRRRAKPKKTGSSGQSSLNLFVGSPEGFRTISGNTIAETEVKIKNVLHLEYETFVSSAYLKQGEADHFTVLRPNERKEVLVSILGLDVYDELAEKARDKASEAASAKSLISVTMEIEQKQLERRPELESALLSSQKQLAESNEQLSKARLTLDSLKSSWQLIQTREQMLRQAESAVVDTENDLKARHNDRFEIEKRIKIHRDIVHNRAEIVDGYSRLLSARQINEDDNRKLSELRTLEQQYMQLDKQISEARHILLNKRSTWQSKFDELSLRAAKSSSLRLSLDDLGLEAEKLKERQTQFEAESRQLQVVKVEVAAIDAEEKGQVRRLAEIAEKTGMLASAGQAAICPVCEAELSEDRLKTVQTRYVAERRAAESALAMLADSKKDKAREITELERHLAMEGSLRSEVLRLGKLEAQLQTELAEAESASKRLPEGEKQITALTQQIEKGEFALEERNSIASLEQEIRKMGYDATAHRRVQAQINELEPFEKRHQELYQAEKLLTQEEKDLDKALKTISELEQRLAQRIQEADTQRQSLSQIPRIDAQQIEDAESTVKSLSISVNSDSERLGSLKQALVHLDELENSLFKKAVELKKYAVDESIYKELQASFGKNGIQAVLIESAIPEMEAEANRLLAKMTDNRMSLKLEMQRATKKGDIAETFDIKIADELGTRDYDLFSGGEAFRINFALRLALSRLLAHRSGAPLRTLVIDEGFGTQDAAGIEKLKEAIASIQDKFECVLVITHIEEFKDAFPARIEVFKTADGSDLRINYN